MTITPDQAALAAAGYTQQAIRDALEQNGVLFPGGTITEDDKTLTVQTGAKLDVGRRDRGAAARAVDAGAAQAAPSTIGDVATVDAGAGPGHHISRVNGEPALTIAVTKLPAANTVDVSQGVRALLPDLEDCARRDAEFTVVFDQAPYIQQSIDIARQGGPARPRSSRCS